MKSLLYQIIIIITFINAYQSRFLINPIFMKLNTSKWGNFTNFQIIPRELDSHELYLIFND